MKRLFLLTVIFLGGCASPYQQTVDDYMAAYPQIELGMSKEQVAGVLGSSQKRLSTSEIKQPDRYMKDGVAVDIFYYNCNSSCNSSQILDTRNEKTPAFTEALTILYGGGIGIRTLVRLLT